MFDPPRFPHLTTRPASNNAQEPQLTQSRFADERNGHNTERGEEGSKFCKTWVSWLKERLLQQETLSGDTECEHLAARKERRKTFAGLVQGGFDYQFAPNWVLGAEAQYSWLSGNAFSAAFPNGYLYTNDRRGIAAALRGMRDRSDCTPMLPEIRCPCLVLVGKHDAISTLEEMRFRRAIRVTLFAERESSAAFAEELEQWIGQPIYMTHFPLSVLAHHRDSKLAVVDVHPPCRGKAEGLRVLEELYGIAPERTVAVGDATNDIPMFEAAGLAVAMQDGMPEAIAEADRVIASARDDPIGRLVDELFLA